MASLVASLQVVKNPPANAGDSGLTPELGKFPGESSGDFPGEFPILVFLPGKAHGQRSLVAAVHGVTKELDTT